MNADLAMDLVGAEAVDADGCFSIKTSVDILRSALKVGVVGSRNYPELHRVGKLIQLLHPDVYVISGGAKGVDQEAALQAQTHGRHLIEILPRGERWIESALMRNELIALCSDVVVAFWTGESKGTARTIRHAMRISGKVIVALPGQPSAVWVPRLDMNTLR